MADEPKKKKEWWDYGDVKRKPSTLPPGKGTPEQQRQGLIMLLKVLDGMKHAVGTHPETVIQNAKAISALQKMSTDFPWPAGYGGKKYADLAGIAVSVYKGDSEAMQRLPETGYDYAALEAKYGKLFPEGAKPPKAAKEPEAEEPEAEETGRPKEEKPKGEDEEEAGGEGAMKTEAFITPSIDDDIKTIFG